MRGEVVRGYVCSKHRPEEIGGVPSGIFCGVYMCNWGEPERAPH